MKEEGRLVEAGPGGQAGTEQLPSGSKVPRQGRPTSLSPSASPAACGDLSAASPAGVRLREPPPGSPESPAGGGGLALPSPQPSL